MRCWVRFPGFLIDVHIIARFATQIHDVYNVAAGGDSVDSAMLC